MSTEAGEVHDWRFVDVALHQLIWPENEKRVFHFIEQNPMIQDNFSALDFLAAHREKLLVVITKRARRENDYW